MARRWGRGAALVALLCVAAAPGTGGAPIPRQTGKGVTFSTTKPGALTGTDFQVHWQNPDSPKTGKPHSVTKVVLTYAEGTVFDLSVPDRCTASDAEIEAQGADACPTGSKLGGGLLTTDNGSPGPTRYVQNTVTVFSNRDDLIFLLETENPPTRLVAHTKIEGRTTTSDVPPTPGVPPPEPTNALRDETLHFPPYTRGGKAYAKTPPTCPKVGYWTNTLAITYADDVTEKLVSRSPCERPKPKPLKLAMSGLPKKGKCAAKDFTVHVSVTGGPASRTTTLALDGRTIRTSTRRAFNQRVDIEDLKAGRHVLDATVRVKDTRLSKSRSFTRC